MVCSGDHWFPKLASFRILTNDGYDCAAEVVGILMILTCQKSLDAAQLSWGFEVWIIDVQPPLFSIIRIIVQGEVHIFWKLNFSKSLVLVYEDVFLPLRQVAESEWEDGDDENGGHITLVFVMTLSCHISFYDCFPLIIKREKLRKLEEKITSNWTKNKKLQVELSSMNSEKACSGSLVSVRCFVLLTM